MPGRVKSTSAVPRIGGSMRLNVETDRIRTGLLLYWRRIVGFVADAPPYAMSDKSKFTPPTSTLRPAPTSTPLQPEPAKYVATPPGPPASDSAQGEAGTQAPTVEPLKFKVASHIVEDLGLNLYTSLPRVLVEFVANAYDADSPFVEIAFSRKAIERGRKLVKSQYDRERALADDESEQPTAVQPLETRALPADVQIIIRDAGIGMSRHDLQEKFLVAGRRRRADEKRFVTDGGRVVMGRKGLGKLAGFGVAKKVEVITRTAGASGATKIVLDYDELVQSKTTDGIVVPEVADSGEELKHSGTVIILSKLLYDPMKTRDTTIENEIADHFALIDPSNFEIKVNGNQIKPTPRKLVFAWPAPELPIEQFVTKQLPLLDDDGKADGRTIDFKYRLRFTGKGNHLHAAERGVRIYANKRLAAAPSLLDAPTGMHGFRMSDYLDGVVHADFIDQQPTDYIATDRQGLRWDSPLLAGMRKFLSDEIKAACTQAQNDRDKENDRSVKEDEFTKKEIAGHDLTSSEKKLAMRVARALGKAYEEGAESEEYRSMLPSVVQAIGHGGILSAVSHLADEEHPIFARVAFQITRLTKDELENFTRRAKTRLKAIHALQKVVKDKDFKDADNEKEIQKLFEASPWLIDPTYTQFLSADKRSDSLIQSLSKELGISEYAGTVVDPKKRPDLVFLIGNEKLGRLIIVELKSANKALDSSHLDQLEGYMQQMEEWLEERSLTVKVEGQLIGSFASTESQAADVRLLRRRMRKAGPTEQWKVRDYLSVLTDTEAAHEELLAVRKDIKEEDDVDE